MRYEVPIIYRGQCTYIVESDTPLTDAQAEEIAVIRFNGGDVPEVFGNEWEEIERVGEIIELEEDNAA